jgi:phosphotransferase family enzyme
MLHDPRLVTLVLADGRGDVRGALPAFEVEVPYWQEAGEIVRGARDRFGIDVVVVRLLDAERSRPPGGPVTYLADLAADLGCDVPLGPWAGRLTHDARRLPWAAAGGPARELDWAFSQLRQRGRPPTGPARQQRTWNLSSLWRIPVETGEVWLKSVPPFFAHEGRVLHLLRGEAVPRLVAFDDGRVLVEGIPGQDLYGATPAQRERLLDLLVDLQVRYVTRIGDVLDAGVTDFRAAALTLAIASVVERTADELSPDDRATLSRFVGGLAERFTAIDACGVPDTLVHGDFHPGNARGTGLDVTVLDWGDCGVGHPLLDEPAFLDRVPADDRVRVRTGWHRRWRSALPGSDPDRAATLLEPVAAARQATIYRRFLDNIEASEHPYHRDDPREWLERTAALVRTSAPVETGG